jgi:hypothetical protein
VLLLVRFPKTEDTIVKEYLLQLWITMWVEKLRSGGVEEVEVERMRGADESWR